MKKAHELAQVAQLKVVVIIYDESNNVMQEFNTSDEFTSQFAVDYMKQNEAAMLDVHAY